MNLGSVKSSTSHVFGHNSQNNSIFISPTSVCKVTLCKWKLLINYYHLCILKNMQFVTLITKIKITLAPSSIKWSINLQKRKHIICYGMHSLYYASIKKSERTSIRIHIDSHVEFYRITNEIKCMNLFRNKIESLLIYQFKIKCRRI